MFRAFPVRLALLAAAMLAAAPLAAQEAPAPARDGAKNPDIVVQGSREELRAQLRQILDTSDGQLARFESQFCPKVIGFPADWTRHLETMIRANAVEAGMKVEPAGCRPTALVIFIDDPQRLVVELRKAMPGLFDGYSSHELDLMTAVKRPACGWRTVEMVDKNGLVLSSAGQINGEASTARIVRNANSSRVTSNVRYDILTSFAAIDIAKTPGHTLRRLADYATMNLMLDLSRDATVVADGQGRTARTLRAAHQQRQRRGATRADRQGDEGRRVRQGRLSPARPGLSAARPLDFNRTIK